jgi:hypothetical protein
MNLSGVSSTTLSTTAAFALLGAHPEPSQATYLTSTKRALSSPRPRPAPPSNKARAARCSTSPIAAPNAILLPPAYTPIDTATAPYHCPRLRLETKGNRGLAPTTARAGFGAHLQ